MSNTLDTALQVVQLINAVTPGVASLVTVFKHDDGTVTVLTMLNGNDTEFVNNIKTINDWLAAHKP